MDGTGQTVVELRSAAEAETIAIGQHLGRLLQRGDLILLLAPFGAGKTHLTKGIAAGLGVDPDEVNSPSFVIVNEYAADAEHDHIPIYHVDLYRVETPGELQTIGLDECLQGDGVCVIEWAEHAAGFLPRESLVVEIEETGPGTRVLRFRPQGPRAESLLGALKGDEREQDAASRVVGNRST